MYIHIPVHVRKTSPTPDSHVFQRIGIISTILGEGHPSIILEQILAEMPNGTFVQNNSQIRTALLDKKIFKVLAIFPFSDSAATKVLHGIKFFKPL